MLDLIGPWIGLGVIFALTTLILMAGSRLLDIVIGVGGEEDQPDGYNGEE